MSQIAWRAWSDEAFAEAREQDKPILLSLTAPWCQFCAAMDEQTYGNEAIAQYVSENFVAVRVDSDKRPDVNARYTQGGWPSTCLLTPDGDILWGGTFVPADGLAQLLPQFLGEFKNNKQGLAQHTAQLREQLRQNNAAPPYNPEVPVDPSLPIGVLMSAKFEFDFAFGGFGHGGQKFPHVDAIELVMEQYARSVQYGEPDADLKLILDRTLSGMAEGGLHDEASGGFFRYTQAPNWQGPQVEKLLEDNAALLRTYSRAYALLGDDDWKATAEKTLGYLTNTLKQESGGWGSGQFADAEYYAKPAEERQAWNAPAVEKTVLAGPNAQAVRAHVAWWAATGDAGALASAKAAADFLWDNFRTEDGAVKRFVATDSDETVPAGLLSDTARLAAANLDLYEAGQGVVYLDRAEALVSWAKANLEDPIGSGLYDFPVNPSNLGNLKVGAKEVSDNMLVADTLSRLFLLTGDDAYVQLAERLLKAFVMAVPQMGFFASTVALAIERMANPPLLVHVVGAPSAPETQALLSAAHKAYRFERLVQILDPSDEDDAGLIEQLGYPASDTPTGYGMFVAPTGETRLAPTVDPETLTETIRTAVAL